MKYFNIITPTSNPIPTTITNHIKKLEILAELHCPDAHIWGDRRGQPIRSATGSWNQDNQT